ncbi:MAG: AraC family transcriptional regulator [Treponema sp.]|jgi:AraC-like DNA-binding protein|nr:AraC family transcriptional regulator [Treponema sp.]
MAKHFCKIFPNENFVDLSLYQFGYEECDPLHSFGPATRNHFLFHYILSGRGRFEARDDRDRLNTYHLEAGQGFLIWPRQHTFYIADERKPWVYAWVEFDGLKARELMTRAGLTFNYPIYTSKNSEDREKMKDELLAIVRDKNSLPLSTMGHLYLFMSAFIASSSLRKKVTGGSLRDFYIRESLSFIEQRYQDEIGVEDIAAFCNLDRSYLGKVFKSVLDTSPRDFLIRFRINKSCELMKITNRTISEVSAMVGYPNQFNFSRTFKSIMGKCPRNWRNENKMQ